MSSTESSISLPIFIVRREPDDQSCKDLANQLQCTTTTSMTELSLFKVTMTLNITYAYNNKQLSYDFNTKIVEKNRVLLNDLMDSLAKLISLELYSISYCNNADEIYFSCGKYPFDRYIYCEFTPSRTLNIKLRQFFDINLKTKLDLFEADELNPANIEENKKTNYYINKKSKRARERTIEEIIKKVFFWKKIYLGVTDRKGKKIKLTLKEAADQTGISQKSLDEYDHQLKYGRLLGFDFNKYKHSKVGVLRGFVRNQMKNLDSNILKQLKSGKMLKVIRKMEEEITIDQLECYSFNNYV